MLRAGGGGSAVLAGMLAFAVEPSVLRERVMRTGLSWVGVEARVGVESSVLRQRVMRSGGRVGGERRAACVGRLDEKRVWALRGAHSGVGSPSA